ncbi:hypothetical protein AB0901_25380 [Streptomyces roseifaciens]
MLASYAAALPLRTLYQPFVVTRNQVAHDQTYLMAKLNAHTRGHAIRRAWQLGVYARPRGPMKIEQGIRRGAAANGSFPHGSRPGANDSSAVSVTRRHANP